MEKNEKTSKVAVISNIILVICAVIICFLAFYINKLLKIQNSLECLSNDQTAIIEEINKEENNEEKISYESFMDNYMKERSKDAPYTANVYEYLGSDERKYELPGITEINLTKDGELHLSIDKDSELGKKYREDYMVENHVFTFKVCPVGNGGYSDLIIVKTDGSVKKISGSKLEQSGKIDLERLEITNVIHIDSYSYQDPEGGGAMGYKLFSIDGTTLSD